MVNIVYQTFYFVVATWTIYRKKTGTLCTILFPGPLFVQYLVLLFLFLVVGGTICGLSFEPDPRLVTNISIFPSSIDCVNILNLLCTIICGILWSRNHDCSFSVVGFPFLVGEKPTLNYQRLDLCLWNGNCWLGLFSAGCAPASGHRHPDGKTCKPLVQAKHSHLPYCRLASSLGVCLGWMLSLISFSFDDLHGHICNCLP